MPGTTASKRVVSIDALRGFDMFWIIGGDYLFKAIFALIGTGWALSLESQLEHATWHGFRAYDLIFPLFLFIVGASMPFSISKRLDRGDSPKNLYRHIIQRALVLVLLGLVYNGLFRLDFVNLRYAGVLQRIGWTYLFAAMIIMHWQKAKTQMIIGGGILLVYWAAMALIPVPGAGMNVLTPEGNLASNIDRLLLPGSFCCFDHGDNEGILSTIPAIVNVLIGVQAGHLLKSDRSDLKKTLLMLINGIGLIILALIWNFVFPINKLLWTSSYVLLTGGLSLLLLALFFWLIDVRGWKRWTLFFVVIGMNPITIYVAQRIISFYSMSNFFVRGLVEQLGAPESVCIALGMLILKWLFLYFLYKQKCFLKV